MSAGRGREYLDVTIGAKRWRVDLDPEAICRIGRASQNTVILVDDLVSRYHAVIQRTDDEEYLVADLGSRNGTLVNGARVNAPVTLVNDDRVEIGDHVLTFHRQAEEHRTVEETPQEAGEETKVGLTMRRISVMVMDIRDSTGLWSLEPAAVSEAMVAFNRESGTLLKQQRAWAQKYSGDGLMALWVHEADDAPVADLQRLVIRSVIGIADVASGLQRRFDLPVPVLIGAGIDSGFAMLGNVGSDARSDHTALGEAVNKAFRLEAVTRECRCDIALSSDTYRRWREVLPDIDFQPERVSLKGFPGETIVYTGGFAQLRELMAVPRAPSATESR